MLHISLLRMALVGWLLLGWLATSAIANYFGVAPTGSTFPGWQPYRWDSAPSFIQEYNTNSGIISLDGGTVNQCCFDVLWAGQMLKPFSTTGNTWCSSYYPAGSVVSVGTLSSWYQQINTNTVWPISPNSACASGGLSFFARTGIPNTCNAFNCIHGTCVNQPDGRQQCQCSKGWYGSSCEMIVPPIDSSVFLVEFTWKNVLPESFRMQIDNNNNNNPDNCRWFIRGYPKDQTDGSLVSISNFNASPYEIYFVTSEAVTYMKMDVWMITRNITGGGKAICDLRVFLSSTTTTGCLQQSGTLPYCYGSGGYWFLFQLQSLNWEGNQPSLL